MAVVLLEWVEWIINPFVQKNSKTLLQMQEGFFIYNA
jgi:hypothetical protein